MVALQLVTPNRMRAQFTAVLLFLTNLFGLMLGGTLIASFTDFIFGADHMLRYSLSLVAFLTYPVVMIVTFRALPYYRRAL